MTTLKEQMKNIGKKGTLYVGGLQINVKIIDFKKAYGNDRWLVTPVSGSGEAWTETNPLV